jgi:uncharacterized protein
MGDDMPGKFVVSKASSGKLSFNLKATNGEVILASQLYKAMAGVNRGIASVRKNAELDERYDRKVSTKGDSFFTLRAANGLIIGKSEMYKTERSRENGISSVKKNAAKASVDDTTKPAPVKKLKAKK